MQTFGLPRQITRGAALASRLCGAEHGEAARRRDAVRRWRGARRQGLSATDAALGVSRATLYRRAAGAEPGSRRPRRVRRSQWTPTLVSAVQRMRGDYPMRGKARIAVLLRRDGHAVSESTTGRILKMPMERGAITPVPTLRRDGPRAVRRFRPHARRLPKGRKPTSPGEIVQLDTLTVSPHPGRPAIKQFTAHDPVAKWTCARAWRRAAAHNAKRFLDKLQADMPFPIEAIQVDGGSEFKADFETECQRRGIDLFELPPRSPKRNGHVERNNGAWRYEFYASWGLPDDDLDHINRWIDAFADESTPSDHTFRPHQALGGHTPAQYLAKHPAEAPRLICPELGRVNELSECDPCGHDMNKREERPIELLIAGGNAAELLELVEEPFDLLPRPVPPRIVRDGLGPVRFRRDDGFNLPHRQEPTNGVAVIRRVHHHGHRGGQHRRPLPHRFERHRVIALSASQHERHPGALVNAGRVHLGGEPTPRATRSLGLVSFDAPAAC